MSYNNIYSLGDQWGITRPEIGLWLLTDTTILLFTAPKAIDNRCYDLSRDNGSSVLNNCGGDFMAQGSTGCRVLSGQAPCQVSGTE